MAMVDHKTDTLSGGGGGNRVDLTGVVGLPPEPQWRLVPVRELLWPGELPQQHLLVACLLKVLIN